jgi:hypothetical protein
MERAFSMTQPRCKSSAAAAILESAAYGMCEITCEARRDMDGAGQGA